MKSYLIIIIAMTFLLTGGVEGLHEKQSSHEGVTSGFVATGNTDQNNRIEDTGDYGLFPAQVEVSFDSIYSELKMESSKTFHIVHIQVGLKIPLT